MREKWELIKIVWIQNVSFLTLNNSPLTRQFSIVVSSQQILFGFNVNFIHFSRSISTTYRLPRRAIKSFYRFAHITKHQQTNNSDNFTFFTAAVFTDGGRVWFTSHLSHSFIWTWSMVTGWEWMDWLTSDDNYCIFFSVAIETKHKMWN